MVEKIFQLIINVKYGLCKLSLLKQTRKNDLRAARQRPLLLSKERDKHHQTTQHTHNHPFFKTFFTNDTWVQSVILQPHQKILSQKALGYLLVGIKHEQSSLCLKISENFAFNIANEASYVYILIGQKLIKNTKNGQPVLPVLPDKSLLIGQKICGKCDIFSKFQTT